MIENNLISVIIPIYNVETLLDRCIKSVVEQTYSNLEIILVDDGSSDNCYYICNQWAKKDSRIKIIHKLNGGLSDARNVGLDASKGELIGFVDADDWIAPEMFERLYNFIINNNVDIAACNVEMIWENKCQSVTMFTQQKNYVLDKVEAQKALLNESYLKHPVWNKLYKKSIIKDIKFPVGKYHEDVFWSYRVIANANYVGIIDYTGYYYWQRKDSIMGEKYSIKRLDAIEAKFERQQYINDNFPQLFNYALDDLYFTCLYHGQLAIKNLNKKDKQKVLEYIKNVILKYPFKNINFKHIKITHYFWMLMSNICFEFTCEIRNFFKIRV